MTGVASRSVDVFVEAGELCHEQGLLGLALDTLAIRLDLAGAGELLTQLCSVSFTPTCDGTCRYHDAVAKHPPGDPHPKPPPPPPPPKPGK